MPPSPPPVPGRPSPLPFPERRRPKPLTWFVLSQILMVAALLPWGLLAGLSTIAVGSLPASRRWLYVALGALWSYPVVALGCAASAWVLRARRRRVASVVIISIPLLWAVPLLGYLLYFAFLKRR